MSVLNIYIIQSYIYYFVDYRRYCIMNKDSHRDPKVASFQAKIYDYFANYFLKTNA